jgi:hypothetical protein
LKGLIDVQIANSGTSFGPTGAVNGAELKVFIDFPTIVRFKGRLGA